MPRRGRRAIMPRAIMPQAIIVISDDGTASYEGHGQSHGSLPSQSGPANDLDERVSGLVSSNALPRTPPPAAATLYNRLLDRYNETRRLSRRTGREVQRLNRLAANFQHVTPGRRLFLRIQTRNYLDRINDLGERIQIFDDFLQQNPGIHPDDVMDSSDDEEEIFGHEPPPMIDYGSDDDDWPQSVRCHLVMVVLAEVVEGETPTITVPLEWVETYGENIVGRRRLRRSRAARLSSHRMNGWEDASVVRGSGGPQAYNGSDILMSLQTIRRNMRSLIRNMPGGSRLPELLQMEEEGPDLSQYDIEEHDTDAPDTEVPDTEAPDTQAPDIDMDEDSEEEGEEYGGDNAVSAGGWDDTPDLDTEEDGTFGETRETNVGIASDSDRPHNWQPFHQYFMYSCRGDITAVTNELQATFHFEPAVEETWVGAQLNEIGNIRKQLEYLEGYLPGESGTMERAQARQEMASTDFFVQDIYDGVNTGQIDIDPTSDAYTEPVRPADLPPTWTPLLDVALLTILPDTPSMEVFWLDHAGVLEELWNDGIGFMRKENAMNMRCGQLRYLKLSEEDLASGRQLLRRIRAVTEDLDPWGADAADTEMADVDAVGG